jgi:hypothetical protein
MDDINVILHKVGLMGLIWVRVLVSHVSMLYVMWEAFLLAGQLLGLQEGKTVGWMTKEPSINFRQGKVFFHLQSIQTTRHQTTSLVFSLCSG